MNYQFRKQMDESKFGGQKMKHFSNICQLQFLIGQANLRMKTDDQ